MNVVRSRCTWRASVPRSLPQRRRRPTTTAAPKHVPPRRQVPVTASTDHPPTAAEWLSNQCWQSATDRSQRLRDRQILTRRHSLPYPSLSGGSEGPERRTRRSSISGAIWESSRRTRPGSTVAMYEILAATAPSVCLPTSCLLFPSSPPSLAADWSFLTRLHDKFAIHCVTLVEELERKTGYTVAISSDIVYDTICGDIGRALKSRCKPIKVESLSLTDIRDKVGSYLSQSRF